MTSRSALSLFVVACLSACDGRGQVLSDATSGEIDATADIATRLVKSQSYGPVLIVDSVTLPFAAASPENVLVMMLTLDNINSTPGIMKADDVRPFYQFGISMGADCLLRTLSYSLSPRVPASAATTTVTLNVTGTAHFTATILEFNGLSSTPGASTATGFSSGAFPRVDGRPGDIVVSTVATCDTATLSPTSDFTLIDSRSGVATAVRVVDTRGKYGADWVLTNPTWEGITDSYR